MAYISEYNGINLHLHCGLVTPRVSGVHSLPEPELNILYLPGRDTAHVSVKRRGMREPTFGAVVTGDTHLELCQNLDTLKGYLTADDDFHALVVDDKPTLQIMALSTGFPIQTDYLPAEVTAVELQLPFLCYPYWEDAAWHTDTIAAATGSVTNSGQMPTYPYCTCAVSAAMAGGLYFEIGSDRFTYTGALDPADVLLIDTDPQAPTVKLNGVVDMANTSVAAKFPALAIGANAIALSDFTKFTLYVQHKRRYW